MASVEIKQGPAIPGNTWEAVVKWVGDNSYAENGEPLTLRECGFGPEAVFSYATTLSVQNLTEQAVYRVTNAFYDGSKVHLYDNATGKELAKEKDASKITAWFKVVCTSR